MKLERCSGPPNLLNLQASPPGQRRHYTRVVLVVVTMQKANGQWWQPTYLKTDQIFSLTIIMVGIFRSGHDFVRSQRNRIQVGVEQLC